MPPRGKVTRFSEKKNSDSLVANLSLKYPVLLSKKGKKGAVLVSCVLAIVIVVLDIVMLCCLGQLCILRYKYWSATCCRGEISPSLSRPLPTLKMRYEVPELASSDLIKLVCF